MKIKGMEAKHLGFVGWTAPWMGHEYDIFDDLWGTPDGKRYVERYVQGDVVEYNWKVHGYIWYKWVVEKETQKYTREHKGKSVELTEDDFKEYPDEDEPPYYDDPWSLLSSCLFES